MNDVLYIFQSASSSSHSDYTRHLKIVNLPLL